MLLWIERLYEHRYDSYTIEGEIKCHMMHDLLIRDSIIDEPAHQSNINSVFNCVKEKLHLKVM